LSAVKGLASSITVEPIYSIRFPVCVSDHDCRFSVVRAPVQTPVPGPTPKASVGGFANKVVSFIDGILDNDISTASADEALDVSANPEVTLVFSEDETVVPVVVPAGCQTFRSVC